MKALSIDDSSVVRKAALRNIGKLNYKAPKHISDDIYGVLVASWKNELSTDVKSACLHTLKNFSYSSEPYGRRKEISAIVAEAIGDENREIVKSATWIIGGLSFGFKPTDEFNDKILEELLIAYKIDRDIPRSWYIQAFENLRGELPDWAEANLIRDKDLERQDRIERIKMEQYMRQREREESEK